MKLRSVINTLLLASSINFIACSLGGASQGIRFNKSSITKIKNKLNDSAASAYTNTVINNIEEKEFNDVSDFDSILASIPNPIKREQVKEILTAQFCDQSFEDASIHYNENAHPDDEEAKYPNDQKGSGSNNQLNLYQQPSNYKKLSEGINIYILPGFSKKPWEYYSLEKAIDRFASLFKDNCSIKAAAIGQDTTTTVNNRVKEYCTSIGKQSNLILIGHCHGGVVGTLLLKQLEEKVIGLIPVATPFNGNPILNFVNNTETNIQQTYGTQGAQVFNLLAAFTTSVVMSIDKNEAIDASPLDELSPGKPLMKYEVIPFIRNFNGNNGRSVIYPLAADNNKGTDGQIPCKSANLEGIVEESECVKRTFNQNDIKFNPYYKGDRNPVMTKTSHGKLLDDEDIQDAINLRIDHSIRRRLHV